MRLPLRRAYRLDPASPLTLNDGFHSRNATDERRFIFATGAEQFVDRKQAQTELKDGAYSIHIFAKTLFELS